MKPIVTLESLKSLLKDLGLMKEDRLFGKEQEAVTFLTFDSKAVVPGTLFICKGVNFKEAYLREAIEKGAIAYVSEISYPLEDAVPHLLVSDIRKAMPPLAEVCFDYPWKSLKTVGVGGTKGKSTTTYYVKAIVDDYLEAIGEKESGVLSTIDNYDGVERVESRNTTPEAVELQWHMRRALDHGIKYMELEVSSQALKYDRVANLRMDVGIFLNISEDHISPNEHKDFEDYLTSKLKMFSICDHAVVDLDADCIDRVLEAAKNAGDMVTYSAKDPSADYYTHDIQKIGHEIWFTVRHNGIEETFAITMPGLFNAENATAAIAACDYLGIPREYMHSGLYRARTSGRMEPYTSKDGKVTVIVDYAHNKLSFESLFKSVKAEFPGADIVSIYGCPGYKAMNRRKDLGELAGKYSDKVILTVEDPGREPFDHINEEASYYVRKEGCPCEIIEDRGVAIHKAIMECRRPTVILILGKGNETRDRYGTIFMHRPSDSEYTKMFLKYYDEAPFHALEIEGNGTQSPEEYFKK